MKEKEETFYEILGLQPNASTSEIRSAFKSLSQMYHPDKVDNLSQMDAPDIYRKIKKAYDTLSDPTRKAIYDQGVRQGFNPQEFKAGLESIINAASQYICDGILSSSSFPAPTILSLAKSYIVTGRGSCNQKLMQGEQFLTKLNKAVARISKGQDTLLVQAVLKRIAVIKGQIHSLRLELAIYDMMQDESKLIEMMKEEQQGLLSRNQTFATGSTLGGTFSS